MTPSAGWGRCCHSPPTPTARSYFHIALLSLWFGLRDKAAGKLRQVLREHPDGGYARLARAFVQELEQ